VPTKSKLAWTPWPPVRSRIISDTSASLPLIV
jgi:hypothetical protein